VTAKFPGSINKLNYNNIPINWDKVDNVIKSARRIMLTTHENPDGDGLGSECGIFYHLKEIGKDVRIINYSELPMEYEYLNTDNIFESYQSELHERWIEGVDLAIIFDVGDYIRIRTIKDAIEKYNIATMNIDHHPHKDEHPFTHNLVDLSAAATGCMVYDYLLHARNKPINKKSIEGIYTAVMTDTGCFRYSNTDKKCHEIAIETLNNKIETHSIYQGIYENSTKEKMELMGMFLSTVRYELGGAFAWSVITQEMMRKTNANKSDVEGFSDMVRSIRGVEVSLMIFEQSNTACRINFRSKGRFSVNDIAKSLGGGGHAYAAGAQVSGSLDTVVKTAVSNSIDSINVKMENNTL
tara:strand:+ start:551 stop:1612 length:1062 start_codon:yes stop_codon:yes gene_type:complete